MSSTSMAVWIGLLVSTACARPPEDDIELATAAYDEAVAAEAHRYSPESFALASRALDDAMASVARQERRALPFRDYSNASALLTQAIQLARGARYEAVAHRDMVRMEAAAIIDEAARELAALETSLPSKESLDSTGWRSWIRRFRDASDGLAEARHAFRAGDYFGARAQALRVADELRGIEGTEPSS